MRTLIQLSLVLFLVSCKTILLNKAQITNPKIENRQSLIEFVKKYNLDTTDIYVLKDTTVFMQNLKKGIEIPEAYFFNKNGEFITYKRSAEDCNAHIAPFLSSIDSISKLKASSDLTLGSFIKGFISLDTHETIPTDDGTFEISIIATSAKYLGKLNKEKVFDWEEIVHTLRASGHKVRYYKVFFDYMDFWGVDKDDLIKIR